MKEITLTQGYVAMVDDEDFEYLNQWNWCAETKQKRKVIYAKRTRCSSGKRIRMHRLIMGVADTSKPDIDHRDGNGLNNQKYNLRIATNSQNGMNRGANSNNTSGYKGVSKDKNRNENPWKAAIKHNDKRIHLGYYSTPEQAAQVYDTKALELYGEFAWLNFPND